MPLPPSPLLSRPLLRDEVGARLRSAIVDGTLAPGEQVRDQELAAWLGVSRTPVREALLELERAGLVRTTPGRSTVIAPLDPQEIRDARDVVAAMHRLAAEIGVTRLDADAIERMREANTRFRAAHARGDVDAAVAADDDFHAVLVQASGSAAVQNVLDLYHPVLLRAERLRFASLQAEESARRHDALLAACERRDTPAAAAIAEQIWRHLVTDTDPTHPSVADPDQEAPTP